MARTASQETLRAIRRHAELIGVELPHVSVKKRDGRKGLTGFDVQTYDGNEFGECVTDAKSKTHAKCLVLVSYLCGSLDTENPYPHS